MPTVAIQVYRDWGTPPRIGAEYRGEWPICDVPISQYRWTLRGRAISSCAAYYSLRLLLINRWVHEGART
jgi:hypothetical protein